MAILLSWNPISTTSLCHNEYVNYKLLLLLKFSWSQVSEGGPQGNKNGFSTIQSEVRPPAYWAVVIV